MASNKKTVPFYGTEEQKQKYRLLANKTGEMTGWDFSKLERELLEVDFGDFDFECTS